MTGGGRGPAWTTVVVLVPVSVKLTSLSITASSTMLGASLASGTALTAGAREFAAGVDRPPDEDWRGFPQGR